jgi:hypothetical protein
MYISIYSIISLYYDFSMKQNNEVSLIYVSAFLAYSILGFALEANHLQVLSLLIFFL